MIIFCSTDVHDLYIFLLFSQELMGSTALKEMKNTLCSKPFKAPEIGMK